MREVVFVLPHRLRVDAVQLQPAAVLLTLVLVLDLVFAPQPAFPCGIPSWHRESQTRVPPRLPVAHGCRSLALRARFGMRYFWQVLNSSAKSCATSHSWHCLSIALMASSALVACNYGTRLGLHTREGRRRAVPGYVRKSRAARGNALPPDPLEHVVARHPAT